MDNQNGWKIYNHWFGNTYPDPPLSFISPLEYAPYRFIFPIVFPLLKVSLYSFLHQTLEGDLRPCFLARENNFFHLKSLQIIHGFDNRYSAVDNILFGKLHQPTKVT